VAEVTTYKAAGAPASFLNSTISAHHLSPCLNRAAQAVPKDVLDSVENVLRQVQTERAKLEQRGGQRPSSGLCKCGFKGKGPHTRVA
jgi:hypothetical protein